MKIKALTRILTLLLALVLCGALLAGCTPAPESGADGETTATTEANLGNAEEAEPNEAEPNETEEVSVKGYATIVLDDEAKTEYRVNLDKVEGNDGLLSVLAYLKTAEGLTYANDATGFLTEVGAVKQDAAAGIYLYIWTSVEADADVSAYATTKDCKGKTLTSSGVGTTDMTMEDGAVILIGTIAW